LQSETRTSVFRFSQFVTFRVVRDSKCTNFYGNELATYELTNYGREWDSLRQKETDHYRSIRRNCNEQIRKKRKLVSAYNVITANFIVIKINWIWYIGCCKKLVNIIKNMLIERLRLGDWSTNIITKKLYWYRNKMSYGGDLNEGNPHPMIRLGQFGACTKLV